MKGTARRLKPFDDVNTDYIISGRYKFRIQDPKELARYIFEDIDPGLAGRIRAGDFIVAGENFGCGSSREQAPQALRASGIRAVLAKSYARIFYRNSFNIGLILVECDTGRIKDGDRLKLDLKRGHLKNLTGRMNINIEKIPAVMRNFIKHGGVISYFRKTGGLKIGS